MKGHIFIVATLLVLSSLTSAEEKVPEDYTAEADEGTEGQGQEPEGAELLRYYLQRIYDDYLQQAEEDDNQDTVQKRYLDRLGGGRLAFGKRYLDRLGGGRLAFGKRYLDRLGGGRLAFGKRYLDRLGGGRLAFGKRYLDRLGGGRLAFGKRYLDRLGGGRLAFGRRYVDSLMRNTPTDDQEENM